MNCDHYNDDVDADQTLFQVCPMVGEKYIVIKERNGSNAENDLDIVYCE